MSRYKLKVEFSLFYQ